MNPGKLDVFVQIRRCTESRAANGSVVKTWSDFAQVWMSSPEQLSGSESVTAQQLQVVAGFSTVIRYGSGITEKDRIVNSDSGVTYEVTRVFDIKPRRSYQEVWMKEVKP